MTASIPLPMCTNEDGKIVAFTNNGSWDPIEIASPSSGAGGTREEECIARLVRVLALNNTVGVLEVACTGECEGVWLPHDLFLGIPLFHTKLCQIVMSRALAGGLFVLLLPAAGREAVLAACMAESLSMLLLI